MMAASGLALPLPVPGPSPGPPTVLYPTTSGRESPPQGTASNHLDESAAAARSQKPHYEIWQYCQSTDRVQALSTTESQSVPRVQPSESLPMADEQLHPGMPCSHTADNAAHGDNPSSISHRDADSSDSPNCGAPTPAATLGDLLQESAARASSAEEPSAAHPGCTCQRSAAAVVPASNGYLPIAGCHPGEHHPAKLWLIRLLHCPVIILLRKLNAEECP